MYVCMAHYYQGKNVRRIMASEGINPTTDEIKAAYVVPKGYDGMKMAPLGKGVYHLAAYMKNDEWGYALMFKTADGGSKLFAEIGTDESSGDDDGGDRVESPLLGQSCAVKKQSGFTMRELDEESLKAGVSLSYVFGECNATCAGGVNSTRGVPADPPAKHTNTTTARIKSPTPSSFS